MRLIYSRSPHPVMDEDCTYQNPRFFTVPDENAKSVVVVGDFPEIVDAYKALGIDVEALDVPPAAPEPAVLQREPLTDAEKRTVDIPDNWQSLTWPKMRALAGQLTNEPVINKLAATNVIEHELRDRE
jgi:hypothetical protein